MLLRIKILCFLFLMIFSQCGSRKNNDNYELYSQEVEEGIQKKIYINRKDSNDKKILTFYNNSNKRTEYFYLNNKKHGKFTIWDSNGNKEQEGKFVNDLISDTLKNWNKLGQLTQEFIYKDGNILLVNMYYPNEKIKSLEHDYSKKIFKAWYQNGNIEILIDDNENLYKEWYEDGSIKIEGVKNNGKRIFYTIEGEIIQEIFYDNQGKIIEKMIYNQELVDSLFSEEKY